MVSPETINETAKTWINGTPYVWGGQVKSGNDCSGFVYGVYKEAGDPFPYRTTAEGFRQMCQPISNDEAGPGDLVFFENTDPGIENREHAGPDGKIASHIGFATDDPAYMLDSHERATGAVGYTNITLPYWRSKLIEYRRPPQLQASSVPDDTAAWYVSFISDALAPDGELLPVLIHARDLLNSGKGEDYQEAHRTLSNLIDRVSELWKEFNG